MNRLSHAPPMSVASFPPPVRSVLRLPLRPPPSSGDVESLDHGADASHLQPDETWTTCTRRSTPRTWPSLPSGGGVGEGWTRDLVVAGRCSCIRARVCAAAVLADGVRADLAPVLLC